MQTYDSDYHNITLLEIYLLETKLDEAQKQEIFKPVESVKSLREKDEENFESVAFGQASSIHDGNTSTHGVEKLEKTFDIKRERPSLNAGKLAYVYSLINLT